MAGQSLQERYAPNGRCFGCGPANESGLRVRSHASADGSIVATWLPLPEHEAWPGTLNGGILGTLIDCHSNWTAVAALMGRDGLDAPPSTVTADLSIRFRQPTSSASPVELVGRVVEMDGRRVTVETTVRSGHQVTAIGRATFVAVGPDHPAYGRWRGEASGG
jgi:acyl-coenzyme A thioesterase PaaI-like protein